MIKHDTSHDLFWNSEMCSGPPTMVPKGPRILEPIPSGSAHAHEQTTKKYDSNINQDRELKLN